MKFFHLAAVAALSAISIAASVPTASAQAREKCMIANSHYTGWEPIWYAKEAGIFKKWGDKYGVTIDVTDPMDYGESINQFSAGQFCALAVTNMDALTGPAAGGIDTMFVVIGDYSNGNDGLLWKAAKTVKLQDTVGKKIVLVEGTVSHYLLWRCSQLVGIPFGKIGVVNAASETDVKNAFAGEGSIIVTWNPILMAARQEKGAQMLCDSSQIPGEIIDGIVVNNDKSSKHYASENARKAIVGAWYEVMSIMAEKVSPRSGAALKWMAGFAGNTEKEFETQLKTTALFYKPVDAVKFSEDRRFREIADKVRMFSAELGLLKNGAGVAQGPDFVGIQFPDGSVVGDKGNVRLRFDTSYTKAAAEGKL